MSKFTGIMMFVLGAAIGSVVTWQYAKNKYEQIAQEEINSVKKVFSKKESDAEVRVEPSEVQATARFDKVEEKPTLDEYAAIMEKEGYTSDEEEELMKEDKPYVISPEEFGEFDSYERVSLTYYADQVLADENDEKIEDVDDVIGADSLTHFGEYEDDSVFVRNDRMKCDYEVLMDTRLYSDVVKTKSHQREA